MIENLKIAHFKGIKKLELSNFGRYNILIGKNDAGKSTVLESIFAFKATMVKPQENFSRVIRSAHRQQHARELWHGYSTSIDPVLDLTYNNIDFNLRFHSTFDFNSVDVTLKIPEQDDCKLKMVALMNQVQKQENEIVITKLEEATASYFSNMMFFDELYRLRIQDWEKEIQTRNLDLVDIYVENSSSSTVDYIGTESRMMLGTGSSGRFIDSFGDGRKSGIALLTLAKGMENSVILVEEIETHQHPKSLRSLILELIKICDEKNNQLFVTTHSPEVLHLFATDNDTKLIHLSKPTDDEIIVGEIDSNNIQMIRDIGWNIGKILTYEKFVLVEGELDKVVFAHSFYKIKGYWPEEVGITIIVAYGTPKQKEILKSISLPEKSIFVQRDLDDNTTSTIETNIVDGFCELTNEGYDRTDDGTKVILTKDSIVKQLDKSKIIITGLPLHFNQISKHATDDYLLYMIEQDPSILNKINSNQNTLPPLQGDTTKAILSTTCGNYGSNRAVEILNNANVSTFPTELKDIIDKIEKL